MNLKKDLLDFFTDNEMILSGQIPPPGAYHYIDGLCVTCENRPYCVWLENNKINCEHYE